MQWNKLLDDSESDNEYNHFPVTEKDIVAGLQSKISSFLEW